MKMRKIVFVALTAVMLAGCAVETREPTAGEFDASKVGYFKDTRTGICFAVISYSRFDTSGRAAGGISHSAVPCSPQVEALLRTR